MLVLGLGLGLGLVVLFYLTNESTQKLCLRNSAMRQRFIARLRDNVRKLTNDGMREWDEDEGGCCVCVCFRQSCVREIFQFIRFRMLIESETTSKSISFMHIHCLGLGGGKSVTRITLLSLSCRFNFVCVCKFWRIVLRTILKKTIV